MREPPEEMLRAYVRAFETLDPEAIATFYHLPSMDSGVIDIPPEAGVQWSSDRRLRPLCSGTPSAWFATRAVAREPALLSCRGHIVAAGGTLRHRTAPRAAIEVGGRRRRIGGRWRRSSRRERSPGAEETARPTPRELGIRVGRLEPGLNNPVTDVKGVRVGHATRVGLCPAQDAQKALDSARSGLSAQGSVGADSWMISVDFAGGIGTSSRAIEVAGRSFADGVLVLSNFGRTRNLTIGVRVVGRELDRQVPVEGRRTASYGSVVTVVATDVPLLASQHGRAAKRAALGLGRVGSHAASSSGEIVIAFSTANRIPRSSTRPSQFRTLQFVAGSHINTMYEAVIEATEDAVLNAMFCLVGVTGRRGREAPPIPQEATPGLLRRGGENHAGDREGQLQPAQPELEVRARPRDLRDQGPAVAGRNRRSGRKSEGAGAPSRNIAVVMRIRS